MQMPPRTFGFRNSHLGRTFTSKFPEKSKFPEVQWEEFWVRWATSSFLQMGKLRSKHSPRHTGSENIMTMKTHPQSTACYCEDTGLHSDFPFSGLGLKWHPGECILEEAQLEERVFQAERKVNYDKVRVFSQHSSNHKSSLVRGWRREQQIIWNSQDQDKQGTQVVLVGPGRGPRIV